MSRRVEVREFAHRAMTALAEGTWVRFTLPPLIVISAVASGILLGLPVALLVLAGGALLLVIALVWGSVQNLTNETEITLEEALSLAAPSAEEEQKRAALRALKDLEYERGVGKISEDDYRELSARYREEAKRLLQLLERAQQPAREAVEQLIKRRMVDAGLAEAERSAKGKKRAPVGKAKRGVDSRQSTVDSSQRAEPMVASSSDDLAAEPVRVRTPKRRCPQCSARNDLDARFCKGCGKPLAIDEQVLCAACPAVYERALTACPECGVEQEPP